MCILCETKSQWRGILIYYHSYVLTQCFSKPGQTVLEHESIQSVSARQRPGTRVTGTPYGDDSPALYKITCNCCLSSSLNYR